MLLCVVGVGFFFSIRVFFHEHWHSQDSRGREGTIFYSTLPLPPAHEHSDIYLQLCMWDDYHIFNRTACIYQAATRWDLPPYRITIWLIDDVMLIFVCLLVDLIRFCYSFFTLETAGLELATTIILVLQANRLTKCPSGIWKPLQNFREVKWGREVSPKFHLLVLCFV